MESAMKTVCASWNTYNVTDIRQAEALLYNSFDKINILILTPCVIILGIITNVIFLNSVIHLQHMQTVTNYYLSALAICDVTLLIVGPSLLIISYTKTVGEAFMLLTEVKQCVAVFSLAAASYYTSVILISLVSTERFYALCSPLRHRAIASKSRTVKLIIASLVIGITFTAINVPSYSVVYKFCYIWPDTERFQDMPETAHRCGPVSFTYYVYQELFVVIIFIVAFIYNMVLYVLTVLQLSRRRKVVSEANALTTQTQQIRNQVARILILNGIVFFVCQVPYRITAINRITSALFDVRFLSRDQVETFHIVGPIMVYINSAINPTLYALSSRFYRKAFMEALGSCRCCGDRDDKSNAAIAGMSTISSAHASAIGNSAGSLKELDSDVL